MSIGRGYLYYNYYVPVKKAVKNTFKKKQEKKEETKIDKEKQ